jgi:type I restriction enzyme S subunit
VKLPPYAQYKPSGVDWLGDLPAHWDVERIKWSVLGCINGVWGEEPNGVDDLTCVRVADFDRVNFLVMDEPPTLRAIEPSHLNTRQLKKGDLLIEKSGGGEKQLVGCVVSFDHDFKAVCSNFVARMPVVQGLPPRYWCYVHAALYAGKLNFPAIKQTTGIQNLDSSSYLNTLVPFPTISEQYAIAAFLARKLEHVDRLMTKKRELIDRLKEKRTALIFRTVTRGLPPVAGKGAESAIDFPLKPSDIGWIIEIPKHWEFGNLRRFAKMRTGHTPSRKEAEYWTECTIPWFTLADVWQLREDKRKYLGETKEMISERGLANSAAELLPACTVVFSRTASIGFSGIMPVPMATTQDFWNWICGPKLQPEYLLLLFRAMRQEFERLVSGSTHKTIYQPDAASLRICVPPWCEQKAIVEYLESETAKLDALIEKVEEAIERLREYRSALITAAVTGKLDVREKTTRKLDLTRRRYAKKSIHRSTST